MVKVELMVDHGSRAFLCGGAKVLDDFGNSEKQLVVGHLMVLVLCLGGPDAAECLDVRHGSSSGAGQTAARLLYRSHPAGNWLCNVTIHSE